MKKGQNIVLEQMFVFTIGLIIFIMIYFSFAKINENVETVTKEDQIHGVGEYIQSCIVRSYLAEGNNTIIYEIPKSIAGHDYKAYFENNILKLKFDGNIYNFSLPENYQISGSFSSQIGKIKIEKINDQITVNRYEY